MKWQEWLTLADNANLWQGQSEKGLLNANYIDAYTLRLWFEDDLDVLIYEFTTGHFLIDHLCGMLLSKLAAGAYHERQCSDLSVCSDRPSTIVSD
jgi:hypothetical protein